MARAPVPARGGPPDSRSGRLPAASGPARPSTSARRRHPARQALGYLDGTPVGAAWAQLSALGRDLAQIQPGLALVPLKLERGVLAVATGSAALAARLRQFEPRLVRGLQDRGWLVERIRFRPIALHDRPPPPSRDKQPVPGAVVDRVEALAADDLPDALRTALLSFVRRQRSYR